MKTNLSKIKNLPDNSIINKIVKKMHIKISDTISSSDALSISNFIIEENKKQKHMIEKTSDEILYSAENFWCVKLSIDNEIIGFMWLYNFWEYYEAWSLCIWEEFRNLWLWTMVQQLLLDNFSHLPIFSVSNVDKVKSISKTTGLFEIQIPELPTTILEIIEDWWKILSDDSIYLSKCLFSNEVFYLLKNNIKN